MAEALKGCLSGDAEGAADEAPVGSVAAQGEDVVELVFSELVLEFTDCCECVDGVAVDGGVE
ncbi:MAG: hypothetical protein ABMA25_27890 [Ilumatobacteraceae bacterium]